MRLKHKIMHGLSSTVTGECLVLLASNAWRGLHRPVYPSSIRREQFSTERDRLWKHLHALLPAAGHEVTEHCLRDQRVLVIGVGSTFGFALLLLALGARKVVCIDPFLRDTDRKAEEMFAEYLLESIHWPSARQRAMEHLAHVRANGSGRGFLVDGRQIRFHQVPLEESGGPLDADAPFDLIISNAVLEHLRDINVAMRRFKALLTPDGAMAHSFGFMNHTLFERSHSQKYLTFSPFAWKVMNSNGSPPNRCSLSHFRRATTAAGLTGAIFTVTDRYSPEETDYAMRHAHPALVADNAEDMSAHQVILSLPRRTQVRAQEPTRSAAAASPAVSR
ncbi:MAG: class I SAM-dependent methyltransferase [Acidobacteriota bacterium]